MKKRTKRDITLFFGVLVILAILLFLKGELGRGQSIEKFEAMRTALEEIEMGKSNMLLDWTDMRKTKGSPKKGGKFTEGLMERDDSYANVVGFMVPLEQFLDTTEFMLLPLPLECYFCESPPASDVMLVTMAEGQMIKRFIEEPVLMNGKFTVNQGADQKFFYTLSEATLGAMEGVKQTDRNIKAEHMAPPAEHPGAKDGGDGMLEPSQAPRVSKPAETD